jgi:hypothetical protein
VEALVLILKAPISVKPPPGDKYSDPVSGVSRIQIIDPRPFKYKALCGQSVRLEGTLDEADTANLETKVIFNVTRVVWQGNAGRCVVNDHTRQK